MSSSSTIFDKLTIRTCIFEKMLAEWKTSWYHQKKIIQLEKLNSMLQEPGAKKTKIWSTITELEKDTKARIARALKYNNEVSGEFVAVNKHVNMKEFIENSADLFCDFTDLLFEASSNASKDNPVDITAALLERRPDGDLEINGERYKIHISKD